MKKTIPLLLALIIIAGVIIILTTKKSNAPQTVDPVETFAQCIKDSGATFYGAFWCPHCNNQKAMFGKKAVKLLPYQECSTADRKQNSICSEAGIESYPTWEFPDGSRMSGELSFFDLSEKTGCALPDNELSAPINEAASAVTALETASEDAAAEAVTE